MKWESTIKERKIDLEDHQKRLKELRNAKYWKKLKEKFGLKETYRNYLIPAYVKIIKEIKEELKIRTNKV